MRHALEECMADFPQAGFQESNIWRAPHLGRVDAGRLGCQRRERRVHLIARHVGSGLVVERRLIGVDRVDPIKNTCRREVLDDGGTLRGRVRIVVVGQREDVKDKAQVGRLAGRVVVRDDCGVVEGQKRCMRDLSDMKNIVMT